LISLSRKKNRDNATSIVRGSSGPDPHETDRVELAADAAVRTAGRVCVVIERRPPRASDVVADVNTLLHSLQHDMLPAVGAILALIAFTLGLPSLAALIVWKAVLGSRPIRLLDAVLIFAVSAPTACGFYGHYAGPVALLVVADPEARAAGIFWAVLVGVTVTGLFCWRSHRRRPTPVN
jgi:hypothetical protein